MILIYVRECDVDAYTSQGWSCWRLTGHHGARGYGAKNFIAMMEAA